MVRKTLIVIDVLNDFLDPAGALYCGDRARDIIPAIRVLIDSFHAENHPVIFLRDAHAEDDKEFELFRPHAVKGTWGADFIPELEPAQGDVVVDKTRFSGFHGTRLEKVLENAGPDEVWLAGVCTSICVMDTAGDLRNRDYTVIVARDAVADFDPEAHAHALKRMETVYGTRMA